MSKSVHQTGGATNTSIGVCPGWGIRKEVCFMGSEDLGGDVRRSTYFAEVVMDVNPLRIARMRL